jgi:hypothetical protein
VVALAERSLDVLEVLEVRVADGLLGGVGVTRATWPTAVVEQRLDLPISATASAGGGLLLGFVGASAAAATRARSGQRQEDQHGRQSKHGNLSCGVVAA